MVLWVWLAEEIMLLLTMSVTIKRRVLFLHWASDSMEAVETAALAFSFSLLSFALRTDTFPCLGT